MKVMCRRTSFVCALLTGIVGALTLIGWVSGWETLASIRQNYIPMAPSTALAFALLGMVMVLRERRVMLSFLPKVLLAVVAVVAGGKLFEFFSGVSLGVEEWMVADPQMFGVVKKGRMSPITALNFLLICGAIYCLPRAGWRAWAGKTAVVVLSISFVVMLGYLHGSPLLYGGTIIPVALPTATAFFLLGISVISAAGPEQWPLRSWVGDSARPTLLRWFLPTAVIAALVEGFLRTNVLEQWDFNPALVAALSTLVHTVLVTMIISQVARLVGGRIDRAEAERNAAQEELLALNQDLERRIAERTRELSARNHEMEEELTMARELQLALLPGSFPSIPNSAPNSESALRFYSLYYPAGAVSGDFFSVFPVSETAVGIFVCDVMGHGVRAALVTSMLRALLEQHSAGGQPDPGRLLTHINKGLNSILRNAGTTMYATAVMMIADAAKAELLYANAGHPNPLHLRRGAGETVALQPSAKRGALGLFPNVQFTTMRTTLEQDDLIMLFTDGLFEVENAEGDFYSQEDLLESVRRHAKQPTRTMFDQVLEDIHGFTQRRDFDDDVCVVGIEVARCLESPDARNVGNKGAIPKTPTLEYF